VPKTINELRIHFSIDFNSLTFDKKRIEKIFTEKIFMRKNVSKFVGKVP